jgi:hypothetical protein
MRFLSSLVVFATLLIVGLPVLALTPVAAVDIFSHCSSNETGAQQQNCSDCASKAAATDFCKEVTQKTTANPVIHIIKIAIDIVSYLAGAAAVIGLIVSGLRLVLANGDANAVSTARSGILYSLVGIGVVVFAQIIVAFVLNRIG